MMLLKKEWKLVMMPVPLLFLLLSALVLVPNYPYYVTFFYTTLGIFLMMQSARENRDLYYMALLPDKARDGPGAVPAHFERGGAAGAGMRSVHAPARQLRLC